MVSFASRKARQHAVMSEDFERELTREVLRTELVRVRALITTGCVMAVFLTAIYLVDPTVVNRVWRGTEGLAEVYGLLAGFILLEVWIHVLSFTDRDASAVHFVAKSEIKRPPR